MCKKNLKKKIEKTILTIIFYLYLMFLNILGKAAEDFRSVMTHLTTNEADPM